MAESHGPVPRLARSILTASQNLLAGKYRDPSVTKERDPAGHAAREEDVNGMIAGALEATSELWFFATPILGEWEAPAHEMMLPGRSRPPAPWTRRGPYPMTRGWCLYELAKAMEQGLRTRVVLGADDRAGDLAVGALGLRRHVVEARDVALLEGARKQGVGEGVVDEGGDGALEGAGTCGLKFREREREREREEKR